MKANNYSAADVLSQGSPKRGGHHKYDTRELDLPQQRSRSYARSPFDNNLVLHRREEHHHNYHAYLPDRDQDCYTQGRDGCERKQERCSWGDEMKEQPRGTNSHRHLIRVPDEQRHCYHKVKKCDWRCGGYPHRCLGRGSSWRKNTTTQKDTSSSSFMEQISKCGSDKEESVDTV